MGDKQGMKTILQKFTLKNNDDLAMVERGLMKPEEVREATETFIVDTGAEMTVVTEELFNKLGLTARRTRTMGVVGGGTVESKVSGAVEIWWKDRCYIGEVITLPDQDENLMGNSSMEFLDLSINTVTGELFGNHGDQIVHFIR